MKQISLTSVVIFGSLAVVAVAGQKAADCKTDSCKIEDNCRCSSAVGPIAASTAPQLVALTFVESLTNDLYDTYWSPLLLDRVNPDAVPIGATFFVPHEYTDYQRVLDLYNYGFEIGVHSISKNSDQAYWRGASAEVLEQEFAGQKTIISTFANIPKSKITGVRTPQLQLAGNSSIKAFIKAELQYDSSWPTQSSTPLFPYTLDYLSTQECVLGSECPNEEFKGFWEAPIIDLNGLANKQCNSLAACEINGTVSDITDWLYKEVNKVREGSRAPLTLIVESHWFEESKNAFEALGKAIDKLLALKDVFFVSQQQVIDWLKNPVPLAQFQTDYDDSRAQSCRAVTCTLKTIAGDNRYMNSCVTCPNTYPWLGNPLGN